MLPFLTPLAEDTLEHPLPKEKRFTASLAVETLEHPLPKERSCNASFLNSISRKEIHCWSILYQRKAVETSLELPLAKERRSNAGASFTKGKELQCFLSFLL